MLLEVLEAVRKTWDDPARVHALTRLTPYLPESLKTHVLMEAVALARGVTEAGLFVSLRARAIAGLAPHLTDALTVDALQAAQAMSYKRDRALVLTALARHLRESKAQVLQQALETARAIDNDQDLAFVDLVGNLPEGRREGVAEEAVRGGASEHVRADAGIRRETSKPRTSRRNG
jgi:hypothetical protein